MQIDTNFGRANLSNRFNGSTPFSVSKIETDITIPEFIRLPKPCARCPYTGLSRSGMNNLVLPTKANNFRPPVRSVSLRKRGQLKAVRLIVYESLLGYARSLEQQCEDEAQEQAMEDLM